MIQVIVPKGRPHYPRSMASPLFRLMALLALLLMPAGMAGAPALAQPVSTTSEHCGEHQQPADTSSEGQKHCAACAALPAADVPEPSTLAPVTPRVIAGMSATSGNQPEIETPPPKRS